jgi:hypothetical protein
MHLHSGRLADRIPSITPPLIDRSALPLGVIASPSRKPRSCGASGILVPRPAT